MVMQGSRLVPRSEKEVGKEDVMLEEAAAQPRPKAERVSQARKLCGTTQGDNWLEMET